MVFENLTRLSKPILWISFLLGLFLSWSVLSGDNLGKVNLLYLIILYVVVPIFSLLYSVFSFFFSSLRASSLPSLVVSFIQNNDIVFTKYKQEYLKLHQNKSPKLVFFYFSQLAAMSFSFSSLLVLFILLLTTDMHFIWRSTLLSPEQILSILQSISIPWVWWESAQPSLELISNSQDDRLIGFESNVFTNNDSSWWKYVLATQIFYAFILRCLVVFVLRFTFILKEKKTKYLNSYNESVTYPDKNNISVIESISADNLNKDSVKFELIKNDIKLDYSLNNWANCNETLLTNIEKQITGKKRSDLNSGPSASDIERLTAERWQEVQVIIVKSWEPPLAELSDFMENTLGYILPLDFKDEIISPIKMNHLIEWQRFCNNIHKWELLLPPICRPELAKNKSN